MKKKSILGRVGIVAAALTLATTSMMSGTLARYAMSKSVGAEAIIAKWNPTIKDGAGAEISGTIDLAASMKPAQVDQVNVVNIGKTGQDRIAPGTKGSTTIKVDVTGAEVPTICTIAATQKDGYTMPGHLIVTIKDGTKVVGTLKSEWDPDSGSAGAYKDPLADGQVMLVGNDTNKALLFPSVRDNSAQTLQSKTFTLEWEWPLDKSDMTSAGEADDDAFNDTDYKVGKNATDSTKFGFGLVVSLKQQGASDTDVVPVTP